MKKCGIIVLGLFLVLLTVGFANAALIVLNNAGFESGNTNSWAATGSYVVVHSAASGTLTPNEGQYFLLLSTYGTGQTTTTSKVYQSFSATADDVISGSATWVSGTKGASVVLTVNGDNLDWAWQSAYSDAAPSWQAWSWTVPSSGTYNVYYSITGPSGSSAAFDAVPIPATALLLASGLIGLVAIRRRKSR